MAKVTVLTPTYRHVEFIGACIESVLAQTFADWQMVIVDDGSDDGTADVADSFRDSRLTVVRREHLGLSGLADTYATAIERATGDLIAILEGDDTWPSAKLEAQVPLFDDPGVVLSYGPASLIDAYGCRYARYGARPSGRAAWNDPVGSILPALAWSNFVVSCTVMLRRSALDAVGGFVQPDGVLYVDHPTWLHLALVGRFAPTSEVVGNWRRHRGQHTTSALFGAAPHLWPFIQELLEHAPETVDRRFVRDTCEIARGDQRRQADRADTGRARLLLLDGQWAEAASAWRDVLDRATGRTRALAGAGLAMTAFHHDLEWLFRGTGRLSWPSRRHLARHGENLTPNRRGDT